MEIIIWSVVIALGLLIEFFSFDLVSIWFSFSGVVGLVLAICNVSLKIQLLVFSILTVLLILSTRKLVKKLISNAEGKTNLELLQSKKAILLTDITENEKGSVKVNGVVWNAISEDGKAIAKGTKVVIIENRGNTLVVKEGDKKYE